MVLGTKFISMKPCGAGSEKVRESGNEFKMKLLFELYVSHEIPYQFSYFLVNLLRKASYL